MRANDNPFNNLNDVPDRAVTAWAALCAWLGLAAILLRFGDWPFSWIAAVVVSLHGIRTWIRFRRRGSGSADVPERKTLLHR